MNVQLLPATLVAWRGDEGGDEVLQAFAITKRIFIGLRHDRRTVALIVIAPVLAMCIFGIAFSGDVTDAGVVVNLDDGPLAARIISNLDEDTLDIRQANLIQVDKCEE